MSTPSGWYDDGSGRQRWWDGQQWTDRFEDGGAGESSVIRSFSTQFENKTTTLDIHADRIELVTKTRSGVSAGKLTAGLLSGGTSLLFTGVGKGKYGTGSSTVGSKVVRLSTVSGISSSKAGKGGSVAVSTPGEVLVMTFERDRDAHEAVQMLNALVAQATAPQNSSVTVQVAAPAAAPAAAAPQVDAFAHLARLAELHQAGVLSDEEFAAAKAKALGL